MTAPAAETARTMQVMYLTIRYSKASPEPAATLSRAWLHWPLVWFSLFTLLLGAVEDIYGNTDFGDVYGSDAVQYLDIARALARHDWHSALNPLWSQGYPALLALARPLFPSSPMGDWWDTRVLNFLVFAASYAAFLCLLFTLLPPPDDSAHHKPWLNRIGACVFLFAAVQTCLGQVSRVNPDELVTALFLLACTLLLRLLRSASEEHTPWRTALVLGLTLGAGFLVKAVFLGLGCGILLIAGLALHKQRARLTPLLLSIAIFGCIVGTYGWALSHAVGYRTLGEAGPINYAWHVDRLQKWVHWEGGVQPAAEAWPKPAIARFVQWESHPPDFGTPAHPSAILQRSPKVYGFAAPVHATYVPYFDPPYFYQGYRHIFRVRYQLIALLKSLGDLLQVFLKHPLVWAFVIAFVMLLRGRPERHAFASWLRERWALMAVCVFGIALYLPVHLEGRYIAGMLLVLGACALLAVPPSPPRTSQIASVLLLVGFVAELGLYQGPAWRNLLHGRWPTHNPAWQMGLAAMSQHLPQGAPVGVIAWTPNLSCDWAYIAHLEITAEIASGPDYEQFWHSPPARQAAALDTFRRAGDMAVFVTGKPPGLGGPEWQQLGGTTLWMARLR